MEIIRDTEPPAINAGWEKVADDLFRANYRVSPEFLFKPVHHLDADEWINRAKPDMSFKNVREVFESAGVSFGEGASASYDPETSMASITNPQHFLHRPRPGEHRVNHHPVRTGTAIGEIIGERHG